MFWIAGHSFGLGLVGCLAISELRLGVSDTYSPWVEVPKSVLGLGALRSLGFVCWRVLFQCSLSLAKTQLQ